MGFQPDGQPRRPHPRNLDASRRLTACKVCPLPVFAGQKYRWAIQPIGISHTECLDGLAESA